MTSEPRRSRVPHTLVLLFGMIVLALLLTWVLPAGQYERVENEHGRMQVVANTFERIPDAPLLSPLTVFTAIPRGLSAAAEIIFFVFIIGGAFAVLRSTGAVDAFLGAALRRLGHKPIWLIVGGVVVFMVGSSTIGMAEEYLPFVPILVALALALGYDAVTGVAIITIGYAVGYGIATINPFTVLIAQDVAGLPPASGLGYRLVLSAVFFPVGVYHLWRYATRVKADPSASLVADAPPPPIERPGTATAVTRTHMLVLLTLVAALALLIVGLTRWGWYLVEMSALFLALAFALALIAHRRRWLVGPIVQVTGVLYTLPSVAVFFLLLPITGRGTVTALIALSLYNLQIIYRNANSGLANVPDAARDAGRGMGMTDRQLLWRVEIPLAVPEIIAGIRIATVSTVAIATLAIFAGAGGLGEILYNEGIQRDVFKTNIVFGSVLAVALAISFDGLLVLAQRFIAPWRKVRAL